MNLPLLQRARAVIPGGVNSPVRAFNSVGGNPLFISSASGPYLFDTEQRQYIDLCLSFGPLILGHAHPAVQEAIVCAARRGTSYGISTAAEVELAELICGAVPSVEKVRLVSSGTEAVMSALRLARGFTGRDKVLKFSGCYHGHTDSMLVEAGSGVAGIASASSSGVPQAFAHSTVIAPYNDSAAAGKVVEEWGSSMAAIIVEPVAANMGLLPPEPGFLKDLRSLADSCGALLIFDEVITGFRFCFGAYQSICGVQADLTTFGKIIGGGMPIGAFGGRREIMDLLAPLGPVYQAGTLSGNPVSVACGLATLRTLQSENPYQSLEQRCRRLVEAIQAEAKRLNMKLSIPQAGSLFNIFFGIEEVRTFEDVKQADSELFAAFFHELLTAGIYAPPSAFEVSFLSTAHDDVIVGKVERACTSALSRIRRCG